jgi:hypothetical protein
MGSYDRGIYLPSIGETGWGPLVDDNFSRLSDLGYNTLANDVVADGVADDTAAFQAIVDAVPSGAGVVPQTVRLAPGAIRLTNTVTISGRAPRLLGSGIGNAADYSVPGEGTTIFWDGPAGDPMFVVEDCRHVLFQDMHIEGNSATPPSDLIFFDGTAHGHGTNELMYFNRVVFGVGFNSTRTTDGVTCATYGVRLGGTNSNNDQFHFNDCQFHGTETGFYAPNSQSIWGWLTNCLFNRCTTAGIKTSASMLVNMLTCNDNAIDVQVDLTAQVDVFGWYSEGTALMADITGNGGRLRVHGGNILIPGGYAGDNLIEGDLGGEGGLELHGVTLNAAQNGNVMPKIYVRGNNSSDRSTVVIDDCDHLALADLDIQANAVGGGVYCRINVEGRNVVEFLSAGEALSTTVAHTEFAGPVITARAELATSATTGFLYVPSTNGAPTATPETHTGTFPIAYDHSDHRLYVYDGDWAYLSVTRRLLSPADVTGLLAWYDFTDATKLYTDTARTTLVSVDGDNIKGVADKSGNGYHLAEGTNPPKHKRNIQNSQHVGRFNGTNQHLSDTTFPSSALPLTMFAIGNAAVSVLTTAVVDGITSRVILGLVGNGRVQAYAGGTVRTPNTGNAQGGWHEYHASMTNAPSSVFVGLDGTETTDNSAGAGPLAGLRIGCDSTVGGGFFDGDLAHVVIVSGAMVSNDRVALARWLGNEMGVTIFKPGAWYEKALPTGAPVHASNDSYLRELDGAYYGVETDGTPAADTAADNYGRTVLTTTLNGAITSGATSMVVASSAGVPSTPFRVIIGSENNIVCTGVAGTTWTIVRFAGSARTPTATPSRSCTRPLRSAERPTRIVRRPSTPRSARHRGWDVGHGAPEGARAGVRLRLDRKRVLHPRTVPSNGDERHRQPIGAGRNERGHPYPVRRRCVLRRCRRDVQRQPDDDRGSRRRGPVLRWLLGVLRRDAVLPPGLGRERPHRHCRRGRVVRAGRNHHEDQLLRHHVGDESEQHESRGCGVGGEPDRERHRRPRPIRTTRRTRDRGATTRPAGASSMTARTRLRRSRTSRSSSPNAPATTGRTCGPSTAARTTRAARSPRARGFTSSIR